MIGNHPLLVKQKRENVDIFIKLIVLSGCLTRRATFIWGMSLVVALAIHCDFNYISALAFPSVLSYANLSCS